MLHVYYFQILRFLSPNQLPQLRGVSKQLRKIIDEDSVSPVIEFDTAHAESSRWSDLRHWPQRTEWIRRSANAVEELMLGEDSTSSAHLWDLFTTLCDHGMPMLRKLKLRLCFPFDKKRTLAKVTLPNLQFIEIEDADPYGQKCPLMEIDAPKLESFIVTPSCFTIIKTHLNAPMLDRLALFRMSDPLCTTKWVFHKTLPNGFGGFEYRDNAQRVSIQDLAEPEPGDRGHREYMSFHTRHGIVESPLGTLASLSTEDDDKFGVDIPTSGYWTMTPEK